MSFGISGRNVNGVFNELLKLGSAPLAGAWREISPRGMRTMEARGMVLTEYARPCERVLFHAARDANPFFHFMEALWILAGRMDVDFLARYNRKIADYSDNGSTFHGAYGFRLRRHFRPRSSGYPPVLDQLLVIIEMLKRDPDSRQAVASIWDPTADLAMQTKDMPCNDLLMFKIREDALHLTVCCRSNDALWGAYGANVVQFSTIQEFVARAIGVEVGVYRQISDSFHVYLDNPTWQRCLNAGLTKLDPYDQGKNSIAPFPLMSDATPHVRWLDQCEAFCNGDSISNPDPFFDNANAIKLAWSIYHEYEQGNDKNYQIMLAQGHLKQFCHAEDWRWACHHWLERRKEKDDGHS